MVNSLTARRPLKRRRRVVVPLALVLVAPDVDAIALRQWSAIDVAVEAGRRAATTALEAGGADRFARCWTAYV